VGREERVVGRNKKFLLARWKKKSILGAAQEIGLRKKKPFWWWEEEKCKIR